MKYQYQKLWFFMNTLSDDAVITKGKNDRSDRQKYSRITMLHTIFISTNNLFENESSLLSNI